MLFRGIGPLNSRGMLRSVEKIIECFARSHLAIILARRKGKDDNDNSHCCGGDLLIKSRASKLDVDPYPRFENVNKKFKVFIF